VRPGGVPRGSVRHVPEARAGRLPVVTFAFVAASLAVSFARPLASLRESLVLERAALLRGELWRLWSGHLVHDQVAHAFWNLIAFAALGVWSERHARARFAWTLIVAAPLSALAVVVFRPDLERYVGASALSSALYVFAAVCLVRDVPDRAARAVGGLALALFALKLALEGAGHWPSPALAAGSGLESVTLAHIVGGAVGAVAALAGPASASAQQGVQCAEEGRTTWHFRRRSRR
jgi:rhomboid family GlyGly-CTERM serine protease